MPTFIDTGEEYLNAAHIISIDTLPGDETIWIRLDTGERLPRSRKYLQSIMEALNIRSRSAK